MIYVGYNELPAAAPIRFARPENGFKFYAHPNNRNKAEWEWTITEHFDTWEAALNYARSYSPATIRFDAYADGSILGMFTALRTSTRTGLQEETEMMFGIHPVN